MNSSNLSSSLHKRAQAYSSMSDKEKLSFLLEAYENHSFKEIADACGTYTNKIVRDAKRLGIQPKDKSQAQKDALKRGSSTHPTKGKKRRDDVKVKISESISNMWDDMDEEERERRAKISKENWESKTEQEKEEFIKVGVDAVRKSAKEGSKLEKYIYENLIKLGFTVRFHQEILLNQKLQIDILLPKDKIAIEVDGPSHHSPIWGDKTLKRNISADKQKNALLTTSGFVVIRIIQGKVLSEKYKRDVLKELISHIEKVQTKFPTQNKRYIQIGKIDD